MLKLSKINPKVARDLNHHPMAGDALRDLASYAGPALPIILAEVRSTNKFDLFYPIMDIIARSPECRTIQNLNIAIELQKDISNHTNAYPQFAARLSFLAMVLNCLDPDHSLNYLALFQKAEAREKNRIARVLSRRKKFYSEVAPYLQTVVKTSSDPDDVENALRAFGNYKSTDCILVISPFLNHTNSRVQTAASDALRNISARPSPAD